MNNETIFKVGDYVKYRHGEDKVWRTPWGGRPINDIRGTRLWGLSDGAGRTYLDTNYLDVVLVTPVGEPAPLEFSIWRIPGSSLGAGRTGMTGVLELGPLTLPTTAADLSHLTLPIWELWASYLQEGRA